MGVMKQKWDEIKTDGVFYRLIIDFNSEAKATADADRWYMGYLLGSGTVAASADGTPAQIAQVGSQPAMPMEMLVQAIQAVAYKDRAEREKLVAEKKAKEELRKTEMKKRKKSTGGKGPRKSPKPKQGSLARSVACAPAGLGQATANPTMNVARAPTANGHAGSRLMDGTEGEQEHNEREPSEGASSA